MRPEAIWSTIRQLWRDFSERRSLIGEITRWSLGLIAAGLIVALIALAYTRRSTASNLADFDLIDFLQIDIAQSLAQCPEGLEPCYARIAENESGGIWSVRMASGATIDSFSLPFSGFSEGVPACARENLRDAERFEIFSCAPDPGGVSYRVAVRQARGGGEPTAFVALEETTWRDKIERRAGHTAAWRSLRTAVIGLGLTLFAALVLTLLVLRSRLAWHFGRLAQALETYRHGAARRVEGEFPREIDSVVSSLNRALEKNDGLIARQRRNVQKMAHDLRHQLVNVDVAARSGEPDALGPEVETLGKLVERYLTLVDWVGPMEGQPPVDLGETLTAMQRAFSRRLRIEPVEITVDCPEGLAARAHPTDLKIILSNLLTNAHKHAASRIRLSAAREDGGIRLSVEDDGPGVPEAERARILDWGTRLDARKPGSGFGLTIVAEQVSDLYGGSLALEDSPLGGLKASVLLPGAA